MKIFIIGASGLVGNNIFNCLERDPRYDVVGSHFSYSTQHTVYFNVFKPDECTFDVKDFKPDVIIHTGALTHVDYCETHPEESYHHTVESTKAAIALAKKCRSKFIYISSDYVFDGENGPYSEDDPVNPLSVYGKHKLEAERLVEKKLKNYLIYRITNVYGNEQRRKNFVAFLIRTATSGESKELKLPSDQLATPINAYDIGRITDRLIRDNKRGIYHLASNQNLSRVELARRVLKRIPGHKITIIPTLTADLAQPAPRPLNGGLKNEKILNEYPDFVFTRVEDYLREQGYVSSSRK